MLVTFEDFVSEKRMAKLEHAAHFFAEQLFSKKSIDDIELEIVLVKNMSEKGNCEVLDHEEIYPTLFRIELKKDKIDEQVTTLAHEMVHMKQYHTNELRELTEKDTYLWHDKVVNMSSVDYHDYPWEIEAYGKEVGLNFKYYKKLSVG